MQQLEKSLAQAPTPGLDTVSELLVDETQAASFAWNSWDSSPQFEHTIYLVYERNDFSKASNFVKVQLPSFNHT